MSPYVERSRGWNGSKINNSYIVSQFRMSHGLQGCKIKKGESKLLSPSQPLFVSSCKARSVA